MKTSGTLARAVCAFGLFSSLTAALWAAEAGRVYVRSTPRGARVYLDDETEPRAKTPCLLADIRLGKHVVRASLTGYVDVTTEFQVTEGEMARATLTFTTKRTDEPAPPEIEPAPQGTSREKEGPPKYIDVDCPACGGAGLIQEMGCARCKGMGYVGVTPCDQCGGTGRVDHRCSACRGTGRIAFGGKEGICARCAGKAKLPCLLCRSTGKIKRANPEISRKPTTTCQLCEGSGFETKAKCLRCSGKGLMTVGTGGIMGRAGRARPRQTTGTSGAYQKITCPFCGGDGVAPPICRRCRGTGVTSFKNIPTPCQACSGTGREFSPCRGCRGLGWIVSR